MSENLLDSLTSKSPLFARFAKDRLNWIFSISAAANMLCCTAAVFSAGLLASKGGFLYSAAFVVMIMVWVQASLVSGFRRHWAFVLFSAGFWLLPNIFMDAARDAAKIDRLTPLKNVLADISSLIMNSALNALNSITGMSAAICAGASILLYFVGTRVRKSARGSDFYCRARIEQLE